MLLKKLASSFTFFFPSMDGFITSSFGKEKNKSKIKKFQKQIKYNVEGNL